MTVFDALKIEKNKVALLDKEVILSFVLGITRQELFFARKKEIDDRQYKLYLSFIDRRSEGCPVSYITEEKEFYSLSFYVCPDVLIPRPDTETLVDFALKHANGKNILDLCCGSGCIGISIAKNANVASITFADISDNALTIAKRNALRHKVAGSFVNVDILNENIKEKYNLILTNPPYIKKDDLSKLDKDVKNFEPLSALDGGDSGLDFYTPIAEKASQALNKGGYLAAEVGFDQSEDVIKIFKKYFEEVFSIKDLSGVSRVVVGGI